MAEPPTEPDQLNAAAKTTAKQPQTTFTWGTLEELLLACAVNRHGTNSWDSVAKELHNRTPSLSFSLFTPHLCHLKYLDLKRRFSDAEGGGDGDVEDDAGVWLDELRRLRVAELKRELHRYDVSIVSLQLKVKKLKEEREKSVKNDERDEKPADLSSKPPENTDRNAEPEKNEPECDEPDRVGEPEGVKERRKLRKEEDSCNGSSNSKESEPKRVESGELGESVAESKDGGGEKKEESSDVQSTASLWRRREKKGGVSSGDENQSPPISSIGKSDRLVDFLESVRGRKIGSVFERRLEAQETARYKSLIREHIDLGIIQKRLEEGQYTDCHTKFYRDFMLLINNAIVFFAKRSSEYKAANELHQLVTKHFQSHVFTQKPQTSKSTPPVPLPKPTKLEADLAEQTDLKPKLAITGPVIASRKRSSITVKSSSVAAERKESVSGTPPAVKPSAGEVLKQLCEKSSSTSFNAVTKKRTKDQSLGSRSSSSKNNSATNRSGRPSPSANQKSSPSSIHKSSPRTPSSGKRENSEAKADQKKPSPGNSSNKTKRGSGSNKDLLLVTLKNSDRRKLVNSRSTGGNAKSDRRKDQGQGSQNGSGSKPSREKGQGKDKESPGSKSTGRPPKRAAAIAALGKRGREGGKETEVQTKKRQRK